MSVLKNIRNSISIGGLSKILAVPLKLGFDIEFDR